MPLTEATSLMPSVLPEETKQTGYTLRLFIITDKREQSFSFSSHNQSQPAYTCT
jgi:hypothetical protein